MSAEKPSLENINIISNSRLKNTTDFVRQTPKLGPRVVESFPRRRMQIKYRYEDCLVKQREKQTRVVKTTAGLLQVVNYGRKRKNSKTKFKQKQIH